jgi:hypothetical protein
MSAPESFERKMVQRALDHVEHAVVTLERQARILGHVTSLQEQYPAQAIDGVRHSLDLARARLLSAVEQLHIALTAAAREP